MLTVLREKDLSYKDIFNLTFGLFIRNFKAVFALFSAFLIPMYALLYFLRFDERTINFINSYNEINLNDVYIVFGVIIVMFVIIYPLITAGLTNLVLKTTDTEEGTVKDAFKGSILKIHKIVPTMFIYYIMVELGMFLIFPGLYFLIIYAFGASAVVVTDKWQFGALKESLNIIRGRFIKTAGFLSLTLLFFQAAAFFITEMEILALSFIPYNTAPRIISEFLTGICQCYFIMVTCVWFINKNNLLKRQANSIDMRL